MDRELDYIETAYTVLNIVTYTCGIIFYYPCVIKTK